MAPAAGHGEDVAGVFLYTCRYPSPGMIWLFQGMKRGNRKMTSAQRHKPSAFESRA